MVNTGRLLMLSADREILVGRLDSAHGIFPELDLTVDAGLEEGVCDAMPASICATEPVLSRIWTAPMAVSSTATGSRHTYPMRFTTAMCYHLDHYNSTSASPVRTTKYRFTGELSMPYTVLLHLLNEDSVVGELESMPEPNQQFVELKSPPSRRTRSLLPAS